MSSSEEDSVVEDVEGCEEEEKEEEEGRDGEEEREEEEGAVGAAEAWNEKATRKKSKKKKLTPGVIYLSRIPPFMRPRKVRHLLSKYGSVCRVYLQPEGEWVRVGGGGRCDMCDPLSPLDSHVHKRRQRFRKNRRRNYTEGWVEFDDKRVAKAVAMTLNNTQIGGKKRYYYHDDIWNMKYLPKFRWSHLTEKIGECYS